MIADHLTEIDQFDADLWKAADDLRANSGLASDEYFMPIMNLLFLRQATNRYYEARAALEADKAAGTMPDRPLKEADFTRRRAMMLLAQIQLIRYGSDAYARVSSPNAIEQRNIAPILERACNLLNRALKRQPPLSLSTPHGGRLR